MAMSKGPKTDGLPIIGRRALLHGAAGAALGATAFGLGAHAAPAETNKAPPAKVEAAKPASDRPPRRERRRNPIVLVPGAWHGGWCWRHVVPRLRAAGHPVYTPTLTGLGERAHLLGPQVDLETHISDIANLITVEELEDVVLVGHSYAGLVITGVADRLPETLAHVVYLDGLLAASGQSFVSIQPAEAAEQFRRLAIAGALVIKPPPVSVLGIPPGDSMTAWVERRLTPHPLATLIQPLMLARGGSASLPRSYIDCGKPSIFGTQNRFADQARSEPGWTVVSLDTGHEAMITAPDAIARLLLQMA